MEYKEMQTCLDGSALWVFLVTLKGGLNLTDEDCQ